MINNLNERISFWDIHHTAEKQGESIKTPFNKELFIDKNVLEIGPGSGRQFDVVFNVCKTYSIADISEKVLDLPKYKNCNKILLKNYNELLVEKFDIIHCWYVIHHVCMEEVESFLNFISSGLNTGGIFYFNYPLVTNKGELANNGMRTTPFLKDNLLHLIGNKFNIEKSEIYSENCNVLLCSKKGNYD